MATIEVNLEHTLPTWTTLPDGRRAIVIQEFGTDNRLLLILPDRGAWEPVHRLHLAAGRMWPEIQADERNQEYRGGGRVIVGPGSGT